MHLHLTNDRMHEVRTEIEISASRARIWEVLMDFPAYAQWNPFVLSIAGQAIKDQQLTITIQPLGSKSMKFKPRVLVADADSELRWLGHFLVPGVFDGEHYFQMTPNAHGGTTFVHGERFSGLMVGLAKSSLEGGTRSGFVAMNKALKARAESAGSM
jgi:hypothetical protein